MTQIDLQAEFFALLPDLMIEVATAEFFVTELEKGYVIEGENFEVQSSSSDDEDGDSTFYATCYGQTFGILAKMSGEIVKVFLGTDKQIHTIQGEDITERNAKTARQIMTHIGALPYALFAYKQEHEAPQCPPSC